LCGFGATDAGTGSESDRCGGIHSGPVDARRGVQTGVCRSTPAGAAGCDRSLATAISGDLLSAVVSTCYILGFRKDNPNVFNMLVQNLPHSSGIKCICYCFYCLYFYET